MPPILCFSAFADVQSLEMSYKKGEHCAVSADDRTVHLNSLESCLQSLCLWLCHNGLALNSSKSESFLFSTPSRVLNFPSVSGVNIAGILVPISDKIITLGVTLDPHLALSHHTSNVCRAAYFHMRALHHIRPSLSEDMAITCMFLCNLCNCWTLLFTLFVVFCSLFVF